MWCDNCLLLLPLRGGAIAWGCIIALYSIVGSIFLFKYGQFFYVTYPEPQIYGGIGMGIGVIAVINVLALSNRSQIWTAVCNFIWPFAIVISLVRANVMIVELYRYQSDIEWECENGGQLWGNAPETGSPAMPPTLCVPGWHTIFVIFIVSLAIDMFFQMYMFFLNWRFTRRLELYENMKGPVSGGFYETYPVF